MNLKLCAATFVLLGCSYANALQVDCAEVYKSPATCERVACDEKYQTFLGTWTGPFEAYSQELSTNDKPVYRSFKNTVSYSADDCLKNIDNGDTFIIGRRTDVYPAIGNLSAKTETGLLITGKRKDGSPFLRTVDENGVANYTLVYKNIPANMSVWSLTIPATAKGAEMTFTTIDGQDFSVTSAQKRNVVVTMSIGPAAKPVWQGVVSKGYHALGK